MPRRRRQKRRLQGDVELNLAAMLDMAFQLLAFFILTFKPSPIEGQVNLRLPPPRPVTETAGEKAGADTSNTNPLQGMSSLVISVTADAGGRINSIAIGETPVANMGLLATQVQQMFADPTLGFDQVIIQVGSRVRYEQLMQVIDICTQAKLPSGEFLSRLSFVELPM
jgi:biopolymer transport protein ExbD